MFLELYQVIMVQSPLNTHCKFSSELEFFLLNTEGKLNAWILVIGK